VEKQQTKITWRGQEKLKVFTAPFALNCSGITSLNCHFARPVPPINKQILIIGCFKLMRNLE